MTSERECFVFVVLPATTEFVVAGRFRVSTTPDGVPLGEFVYGRSYLNRPDALELDPVELRLGERPYQTTRMSGFFGAIRDAMPDYWGRLLIERRFGAARPDEFDYLLEGPDDRARALGFGTDLELPRPGGVNSVLDLGELQAAADSVLAGERGRRLEVAGRVRELLLAGTSMGGARPKAVVEDTDALWVAKFGRSEDRWNDPLVEHALLRLARRCGLNAAISRTERVGDRDVLLVRRFDRERLGAGYARSRMASALTLLRADDHVTDRRRWSYLALADEVRRASSEPRADLRELFGRVCFNAAISNLDDHPRNHAIVARGHRWRLSPAYDLTPVPAISVTRRDLAMRCGPMGRWANRANLIGGAGRFLLHSDEAAAIFDRVVGTIRSSWLETMRSSGVSERDCDRIRHAILYDGLFFEAGLLLERVEDDPRAGWADADR